MTISNVTLCTKFIAIHLISSVMSSLTLTNQVDYKNIPLALPKMGDGVWRKRSSTVHV